MQTLILGEVEAWRDLKKQSKYKYEIWRKETIAEEQRKAAVPLVERIWSKALCLYSTIPPIYVISFIALLLAVIIAPRVGKGVLEAYTAERTFALNSTMQSQADKLSTYEGQMHAMQRDADKLREENDRLRETLQQVTHSRDTLNTELDLMGKVRDELQSD